MTGPNGQTGLQANNTLSLPYATPQSNGSTASNASLISAPSTTSITSTAPALTSQATAPASTTPAPAFNPAAARALGETVIPDSNDPTGYMVVINGEVYSGSGQYLYSTNSNIGNTTLNGITAPTSLANYTAPVQPTTTAPSFAGNNINELSFSKNAQLGFTDATHFTGSYVNNGQTINFTGLLPTTYEYLSDPAKQELALDIAWDSINRYQMPSTPGGSVPIPIQIDTAIPTATGGITASGGGYITPANNPASMTKTSPITFYTNDYGYNQKTGTYDVNPLLYGDTGLTVNVPINYKLSADGSSYIASSFGNGSNTYTATPLGSATPYTYTINPTTGDINITQSGQQAPITTIKSGIAAANAAANAGQQTYNVSVPTTLQGKIQQVGQNATQFYNNNITAPLETAIADVGYLASGAGARASQQSTGSQTNNQLSQTAGAQTALSSQQGIENPAPEATNATLTSQARNQLINAVQPYIYNQIYNTIPNATEADAFAALQNFASNIENTARALAN